MKKLFTLKKWLTLQEAARHLSIVFGEEISKADVLRLALDGHLKLSVNFVNRARARGGQVLPIEEAEYDEYPPGYFPNLSIPEEYKGKPIKVIRGINLDDKRVLILGTSVETLDGVYDLAMLGNERTDVEHEYQMLTNGPSVTLQGLDGTFLFGEADTMYQLLESFDENEFEAGSSAHLRELKQEIVRKKISDEKANELLSKHTEDRKLFLAKAKALKDAGRDLENYHPAGGLPDDSVIVVRTDALREFEQSLNSDTATKEKPLSTTERNTLLTIIAALCDYSAIDIKARNASSQLAGITAEIGAPVTDETVRKVLSKISDAVERRMK